MSNISNKIADILTKHNIDIMRVEASIRHKIVALINGLEQELIRKLKKVDPGAPTNARYRNTRIKKLLKLTDDDFSAVYKEIENEVTKSLVSIANVETVHLVNTINKVVNFELASNRVPKPVLNVLARKENFIDGAPSGAWWAKQTKDMKFAFSRAITEGVRASESIDDIVRRVRGTRAAKYKNGIMEVNRRQAQALVRTSVQSVTNEARFRTLKANADVVKGYQWLSTLDSRTTHICFTGETKVTVLGKLENIFRSDYSGDIYTITTATGDKIEGTPNHPILTNRGWLPIHKINPNEHIVYSVIDNISDIKGCKDVCMPTTFTQLYNSFNHPTISNIVRESSSTADFYGDGMGGDSKVDIVTPHSCLRKTFKTRVSNKIIDSFFSACHRTRRFFTFCRFVFLFCRRTPVVKTPKSNTIPIKDTVHTRFRLFSYFYNIRRSDTAIKQFDNSTSIGDDVRNTVSSFHGGSNADSVEIRCNSRGSYTIFSANKSGGFSIPVKPNNIISISVENKSCHVYTLQTDLGLYSAGSIIVKNCMALDGQAWDLEGTPIQGSTSGFVRPPPAHWNALAKGSMVLTKRGEIPIEDVRVGDLVLTHKGRYKPVYTVMSKVNDSGIIRRFNTDTGRVLFATDDHPILVSGRGWKCSRDVNVGDKFFEYSKKSMHFINRIKRAVLCVPYNYPSFFDEHTVSYTSFSSVLGSDSSGTVHFKSDFMFWKSKIYYPILKSRILKYIIRVLTENTYNHRFPLSRIFFHGFRKCLSHFISNVFIFHRIIISHIFTRLSIFRMSIFSFTISPVLSSSRPFSNINAFSSLNFRSNSNFKFFAPVAKTSIRKSVLFLNSSKRFIISKMAVFNDTFKKFFSPHVWNTSKVIDSSNVTYDDVVYNLAVKDDESFIVNKIVVHNCRSTIIPLIKSFEELMKDKNLLKKKKAGLRKSVSTKKQRASMDGAVSEKLNYEEWLKRKDAKNPEFAKSILGAGRYDLWKKGKLSFSQLIDQSWNPLTIEQLEAKILVKSTKVISKVSKYTSAKDWYKRFNDPKANKDSVLAKFPSDTAAKIKAVEDRLSKRTSTDKLYLKDGKWDKARVEEVHKKIIAKILSKAVVKNATPKAGVTPQYVMFGGRGGSGKGSFTRSKKDGGLEVINKDKFLVLDSDEIKQMLPEYKGWNAFEVHKESSYLFGKISKLAKKKGLNIVHDMTMKTTKGALEKVKEFKKAGYTVDGYYMFLPRQDAAERAVSRFLGKTNRYVPTDVVLSNTTNEESFDLLTRYFRKWAFYDNQGKAPELIAKSK